MNQDDIEILIKKYLDNTATAEEKLYLQNWYLNNINQGDTIWNLDNEDSENNLKNQILSEIYSRLEFDDKSVIKEDIYNPKRTKNKLWLKYAAFLACLIGLSITYYFFNGHKDHRNIISRNNEPEKIIGGKNGAILTLSNGRQIQLEKIKQGSITDYIQKQNDSTLSYAGKSEIDTGFNILETPIGCQYRVILPDQTMVWLDAGSSLKYASTLAGKPRMVYLTGEAYFIVKHDPIHPFRVKVGNQIIEDIGTVFNVNAYDDESSIKATLIQGAIKIGINKISPGEQAVIKNNSVHIISVDTMEAVGWKNGYFIFNNTEVKEAMKQIARWYNVRIEYKGGIPDIKFGGGISRNNTANEVLSILEQNNIHFKIENRKIIVMP
ncbi:MAG: FecR family protein [Arachidicoccus sp.]|nr:FecR family protein [Arachidicoccus sp.]